SGLILVHRVEENTFHTHHNTSIRPKHSRRADTRPAIRFPVEWLQTISPLQIFERIPGTCRVKTCPYPVADEYLPKIPGCTMILPPGAVPESRLWKEVDPRVPGHPGSTRSYFLGLHLANRKTTTAE